LENKVKILFNGKNHSQALKDLDPSSLSGAAQNLGFEMVNSLKEAPDVVICVDYDKSAIPTIRDAKTLGIRTVLIINEPDVVIPEHSQARILSEFDMVVKVARPQTSKLLKWPQTWLPLSENRERLDRVVLVNADKWSYVQGQHYWLRAAVSSQLDRIDVFGFGWDRPLFVRLAHRAFELWRTLSSRARPQFQGLTRILARPKNYKGSIRDKNSAMKNYKVALVVENSSEFLTEKLFDAWFAGCIPVYVGPSVEAFGIPSNLVFQVQQPSVQEVIISIDAALAADWESYFHNLKDFLSSDAAAEWKAESALAAIVYHATDAN
jgi:hypothetical protein